MYAGGADDGHRRRRRRGAQGHRRPQRAQGLPAARGLLADRVLPGQARGGVGEVRAEASRPTPSCATSPTATPSTWPRVINWAVASRACVVIDGGTCNRSGRSPCTVRPPSWRLRVIDLATLGGNVAIRSATAVSHLHRSAGGAGEARVRRTPTWPPVSGPRTRCARPRLRRCTGTSCRCDHRAIGELAGLGKGVVAHENREERRARKQFQFQRRPRCHRQRAHRRARRCGGPEVGAPSAGGRDDWRSATSCSNRICSRRRNSPAKSPRRLGAAAPESKRPAEGLGAVHLPSVMLLAGRGFCSIQHVHVAPVRHHAREVAIREAASVCEQHNSVSRSNASRTSPARLHEQPHVLALRSRRRRTRPPASGS